MPLGAVEQRVDHVRRAAARHPPLPDETPDRLRSHEWDVGRHHEEPRHALVEFPDSDAHGREHAPVVLGIGDHPGAGAGTDRGHLVAPVTCHHDDVVDARRREGGDRALEQRPPFDVDERLELAHAC